ncbi:PREDICTED: protein HIRA-like [Priapulus caudatus]|uniref:Protein HIRA n=1 Tax=Priapulus caudatus TaxID=37621 RepID=A0ABM1EVS4_PRICU|nr:PREDICTED: protein HIRA-like [Priapulus caudatus]
MKLLKPSWVNHDGKPIFSIDIHPDGSRFATGGQGKNSGKVVVWNMGPVKNEEDEKDVNMPKMLCTMDNHLACVNCVRWSHSGRYLASGGDDKLVMIWQFSKYGGSSSAFGTGGKVENVEQWRCVYTLRGHSGDVLDLAWSPQDTWVATCSVDNSVVIWNANKFPEIVTVIRGHNGLVKGVTWDPVGRYLATQSDDKSLRIWRTSDWHEEYAITKAFEESGGTTLVLRLGWSPDGCCIVSAHATNNSGPTAQIIERDGWKTNLDFVGHRKAITCTRFNKCVFSKALKKNGKPQQYACCAVGSRDRSLSVWLTALKRPLVVVHDLFSNSILDISWSTCGTQMLVCSWDGTCAYLEFAEPELGKPLTDEEKDALFKKQYGQTYTSLMSRHKQPKTMIVEHADVLQLQRQRVADAPEPTDAASPEKPLPYQGCPTNKQIETRTPDGRRRITPLFIASQQIDLGGSPEPFKSRHVTSYSCEQKSKIVIEKKDEVTMSGLPPKESSQSGTTVADVVPAANPTAEGFVAEPAKTATSGDEPLQSTPSANMATMTSIQAKTPHVKVKDVLGARMVTSSSERAEKISKDQDQVTTPKTAPVSAISGLQVKRKAVDAKTSASKRSRKDWERKKEKEALGSPAPVPTSTTDRELSNQGLSSSSIQLPVSKPQRVLHATTTGEKGCKVNVCVENNMTSTGPTVHTVKYMQDGKGVVWEAALGSRGIQLAASRYIVCVGCEDRSVVMLSQGGRRLLPSMVLSTPAALMQCNGHCAMAITADGSVFVWNLQKHGGGRQGTWRRRSVCVRTGTFLRLTAHAMACWLQVATCDDIVQLSSRQSATAVQDTGQPPGLLQQLYSIHKRSGRKVLMIHKMSPALQQASTASHLESEVAAALALGSTAEYRRRVTAYVRYLSQEGLESRLREVCDTLLGPTYKTTIAWNPYILGFSKRQLLREVLPLVGGNLQLQRLYMEYQRQLDTASPPSKPH